MVFIAGSWSDLFLMKVGLHQSYLLSPILYITVMNRIVRGNQRVEEDIGSLDYDLQLSLEQFTVKCERIGMRITTSSPRTMIFSGLGMKSCPKWRPQGRVHK